MFSFFKKQKELPGFDFIKTHPKKDLYFYRTKKWDWHNPKEIFLAEKDPNDQIKMTTMDFWSQEMFLDANGQRTLEEYLVVLINQFKESKMKIPEDLDVFMIETLESLNNDLNAIEFSVDPVEVSAEFAGPLSQ